MWYTSLWLRQFQRFWKGTKEAFIMFMLTEKRAVQWPHLTVTTMDKLLHGTLTCVLDRYENKKPEEKYGKRRYIYIYIYIVQKLENLQSPLPVTWWCRNHIVHSIFVPKDQRVDWEWTSSMYVSVCACVTGCEGVCVRACFSLYVWERGREGTCEIYRCLGVRGWM